MLLFPLFSEALWDLAKARLEKKSNHLIGYLQLGLKKHHYLPLGKKIVQNNYFWSKPFLTKMRTFKNDDLFIFLDISND